MSAETKPGETDRCACSHFRRDHSGRSEKKRCTAKVIGLGQCDCTDFRNNAPKAREKKS